MWHCCKLSNSLCSTQEAAAFYPEECKLVPFTCKVFWIRAQTCGRALLKKNPIDIALWFEEQVIGWGHLAYRIKGIDGAGMRAQKKAVLRVTF